MTPVHWQYRVDDRVATVSLNRAETGNNVNLECLDELKTISEQIQGNPGIHAVVLKSEGKHFSVGMDVAVIQQMVGQPFGAYDEHLSAGQRCIDVFEAIDKPIVAEIKGFCIDRYEAHLVRRGPAGEITPYPHFQRPEEGVTYEARSEAGAFPQAYISRVESEAACTNAEKRLCTRKEWQRACMGESHTPYPYGARWEAKR